MIVTAAGQHRTRGCWCQKAWYADEISQTLHCFGMSYCDHWKCFRQHLALLVWINACVRPSVRPSARSSVSVSFSCLELPLSFFLALPASSHLVHFLLRIFTFLCPRTTLMARSCGDEWGGGTLAQTHTAYQTLMQRLSHPLCRLDKPLRGLLQVQAGGCNAAAVLTVVVGLRLPLHVGRRNKSFREEKERERKFEREAWFFFW